MVPSALHRRRVGIALHPVSLVPGFAAGSIPLDRFGFSCPRRFYLSLRTGFGHAPDGGCRNDNNHERNAHELLKRSPFLVILIFAAALLASASTWFYANHILRAQQIADAALHHQPRGNFSDLYPRWLGARELLKHGRNPYSAEITREIQQGY